MRLWIVPAIIMQVLTCCNGQSFSEDLWTQTENLRKNALETTYIQGMINKDLDPTKFGTYNLDDTVYCYKVKELFYSSVEKTNDPELQEFFQNETVGWDSYATYLMGLWHVEDIGGIKPGPACSDYLTHLGRVANGPDPIYLVIALTPCARLWPWIGGQINDKTGEFGVYNDWVRTNFDSSSNGYLDYQDMIDKAYQNGAIDQQKALDIYTQSMENEVAFFNLDAEPKKKRGRWTYEPKQIRGPKPHQGPQ